jgi:hypothetical protein
VTQIVCDWCGKVVKAGTVYYEVRVDIRKDDGTNAQNKLYHMGTECDVLKNKLFFSTDTGLLSAQPNKP